MVAFKYVGVGLLSLLLPSVWAIDQGKSISLNGINYYVGGIPASKLVVEGNLAVAAKQDEDVIPMTVIRMSERVFSQRVLEETVKKYTEVDDVFQTKFLSTSVSFEKVSMLTEQQSTLTSNATTPAIANATLSAKQNKLLLSPTLQGSVNATLKTDQPPPPGPYFVSVRTGDVYKAFRLYPDHQLAFTEAAFGDGRGGLGYLPVVTEVSLSFYQ